MRYRGPLQGPKQSGVACEFWDFLTDFLCWWSLTGNRIEEGEAENGRHFIKFLDPFPKPTYL